MHRLTGSAALAALLLAAPAFACEAQQEIDPCTGRPYPTAVARPDSTPAPPEVPVEPPTREPEPTPKPLPPPRDTTSVDTAAADGFRAQLRLGGLARGVRAGPAASLTVPTGLGAAGGEAFVGVGFQTRTRYTRSGDAGAVAGVGFGDARTAALEVAVSSYSTFRSAPFATGGVSARVHRLFGEETSAALGWENLATWGRSDAQSSVYLAATRLLRLREDPREPLSAAALTLGVGNGRFRREADDLAGRETANLFGAAALRVLEPVSLVADWTGQDLAAGLSVTPLLRVPLVVSAGAVDLTGRAGDGARFILSVGYGIAVPWRL
jgi:hypothetical protein